MGFLGRVARAIRRVAGLNKAEQAAAEAAKTRGFLIRECGIDSAFKTHAKFNEFKRALNKFLGSNESFRTDISYELIQTTEKLDNYAEEAIKVADRITSTVVRQASDARVRAFKTGSAVDLATAETAERFSKLAHQYSKSAAEARDVLAKLKALLTTGASKDSIQRLAADVENKINNANVDFQRMNVFVHEESQALNALFVAPIITGIDHQELPPNPVIEGAKATLELGLNAVELGDEGVTAVINKAGAFVTLGMKNDLGDEIDKIQDVPIDMAASMGEVAGTKTRQVFDKIEADTGAGLKKAEQFIIQGGPGLGL